MAHVLLIEPDMLLARHTREYLEGCGHSVQWRSDAQAAINGADEISPDIVVMEMQLATNSGMEFLYEFRSYADWQHVPIIILTSVPRADFDSSSILWEQLEVVAYYYKPEATLSRVARTIDQALRPAGTY